MAHTHPFTELNQFSLFAKSYSPALFNGAGIMKERAGFSSYATGKPLICQVCVKETLFLHQYKRYEEKYCCIACIDSVLEH